MEESGEGFQAFEFIDVHKKDIESVTIVLITNNEAVPFAVSYTHLDVYKRQDLELMWWITLPKNKDIKICRILSPVELVLK